MTIRAGVCTILTNPSLVLYSGPTGRQCAVMESLPKSSVRCFTRACAHGWTSSGLRSATMLAPYLAEILFHTPVRSGLPSGVRGAGAVRFGLPSAVRGIPGVRWCTHCAASGVTSTVKMVAGVKIFIGPKPPCGYYTPKDCRMPLAAHFGLYTVRRHECRRATHECARHSLPGGRVLP